MRPVKSSASTARTARPSAAIARSRIRDSTTSATRGGPFAHRRRAQRRARRRHRERHHAPVDGRHRQHRLLRRARRAADPTAATSRSTKSGPARRRGRSSSATSCWERMRLRSRHPQADRPHQRPGLRASSASRRKASAARPRSSARSSSLPLGVHDADRKRFRRRATASRSRDRRNRSLIVVGRLQAGRHARAGRRSS